MKTVEASERETKRYIKCVLLSQLEKQEDKEKGEAREVEKCNAVAKEAMGPNKAIITTRMH